MNVINFVIFVVIVAVIIDVIIIFIMIIMIMSLRSVSECRCNCHPSLTVTRHPPLSSYIGKTESEAERAALEGLNDVDANMDEEALQMLLEGG